VKLPEYEKPWAAKMVKKPKSKERAPEPVKKSQDELDEKAEEARK